MVKRLVIKTAGGLFSKQGRVRRASKKKPQKNKGHTRQKKRRNRGKRK